MYGDLTHRNFDLLKKNLLTGINFPCLVIIDVNYSFLSEHVSAVYSTIAERLSWNFRKSSLKVTFNYLRMCDFRHDLKHCLGS